MNASSHSTARQWLTGLALVSLAGCDVPAPVGPGLQPGDGARRNGQPEQSLNLQTLAELRRATARYHDVAAAIADGYRLFEECETVPGEGAAGAVYVNFALVDATIDASHPEALLYDPAEDGSMELVGAEIAVPIASWTGDQLPQFAGATLEQEGDGPVYSVHVWIWRHNPDGMFAPTHPHVSC